jgi:uncharacterized RDD family membrane protein YckC
MKSIDVKFFALCGAVLLGCGSGVLHGQSAARSGLRASVALTSSVAAPLERRILVLTQDDMDGGGWGRNVLRVGQDYALKEGESVREVVVVFSPAIIEGYVRGDMTVVLGTVQIGRTAVIGGSLIVVGGNVTVQPGAAVHQDLVVIGGGLDAPPDFVPGRQHVAIGATALADRVRSVVPWITQGLLLGRPIVPTLSWVWLIVFFVFLASLALNLLFLDTVRTCADAIAARPFTTFLTGLLVLLLIGPVAVILAASVIGILVVPFVLCAVVVAWIIGKVGVSVRLGDSMVGQTSPASRLQSVRSFVIGFAAICLIYMVPVLGFIAWALVGVTGLGAAALAFTSAYRRENPAPPKPAPPPPPPLPPFSRQPDALDLGVVPPVFTGPVPTDAPPAASLPNGAATIAYAAPGPTTNLLVFPKAGFFERAAAFALDTVFVLIVCGTLDFLRHGPGPLIFLMLAYHIGFWAWKCTTFGGIVCQLRVVRLDGSPLRFVDALVRGIASLFSVAVAGLGCLWILKDEERQSWHDKIAGTYVVTVPRNWPLT